jgi:hypothetical protein
LFAPVSKGQRPIIVHASDEDGFEAEAYLQFKSHLTTGDCHSVLIYEQYEEWLKEKPIHNLPKKSVMVIDNAPFHNVQVDQPPRSNLKNGE